MKTASKHAEIHRQKQAARIIEAARELHEVCYRVWADCPAALPLAAERLRQMMHDAMELGQDIDGWCGGCLTQYDGAKAALDLIETFY